MGWVKAWSAGVLSIERDPDRSIQSIPVPAIKALEASQGKKGHAVTGAAFGFLVGGIVGVGVGQAVMNSGEYDDYAAMGAGVAAWAGTAVVGAILGASIGSFTKTERWKRVPDTPGGG